MPDEVGGNRVDVDPARIDAELSALAGDSPAPEAGGQAGQAADWTVAAGGVVAVFSKLIAPAWGITDAEQAAIADPLAQVLAQFFPAVQMDPRFQAVGALVLAVGGVALSRYDGDTGQFRPLRNAPKGQASGGGSGIDALAIRS